LDDDLGAGSALPLIAALKAARPELEIAVVTARASVAEAVQSLKLGATGYLAKPVTADQVLVALGWKAAGLPAPSARPVMSLQRAMWEYIQRVLDESGGSVRKTAGQLGLHRRTLQRMLAKNPPER
jgi:two-component system response regulator RegA